jgi:hypothetical protein
VSTSKTATEGQEAGMSFVDRTAMTGAAPALVSAILGLLLFAASPSQAAARVNIVAIGGSNTGGKGVGPAIRVAEPVGGDAAEQGIRRQCHQ